MTQKIIGFSGNLDRPSKTRTLVQTVVQSAATRFDAIGAVFDLADFGPSFPLARRASVWAAAPSGSPP